MKKLLIIVAVGVLTLSSLLTPASASQKGSDILENKSPCDSEAVNECIASGGRFNWSNCMCYWW